ncbi:GNAT family N-acetyltransferase [Teredinibacter purpureus]|uniref:GNAT family N-acetyltransferase n=1 Tax=Teredinibacter purpureus TaxID=2731756 RepID=UPI0006979034|nr:GNAT family N-acetyltransferase [Teredinibacter purpureus]
MEIEIAQRVSTIKGCFPLMLELRPHLQLEGFVASVERMQRSTGYQLAVLTDGSVKAVAGFRVSEWLHTGRYLELEELVTQATERSRGYGGALFDWLCNYARDEKCNEVRLVSGVARERAHAFYQKKGMVFEAKYYSMCVK